MRMGVIGAGRIGAFHIGTLTGLDAVDEVVVTDADADRARAVGADLGVRVVDDLDALLAAGIDGIVIATSTPAHADEIEAAVRAGIPTFCEKPVAGDLARTIELAALERATDIPIHIGFQRRFDEGYRRAADAVRSGELGFVHTLRSTTHDQRPPHASYIPTSGGIFRDCNIHDFDVVRFVTGREVARVYATGGNKGEQFFRDAGDVDTGAALLTLDDGTIALVTSTRYNGAGHDVRLEVSGSEGAIGVGLDHSLALDPAEPGVDFPRGPRHATFMDRFLPAYRAELAAFAEVAAGARPSPCTVADGLAAFRIAEAAQRSLDEGRPVDLDEIDG